MRRSALLVIVVLCGILLLSCAKPVQAAKFSNVLLRLDRTQVASPLSGLVCATPSDPTSGTEGKVSITFPTSFTISGNISNWTTDTSDIPSSSTPWPGIGSSAESVSGKTVTFTSNDLVANTTYCFTFSGSSSQTGIVTGHQTATITTTSSSGTTIDSSVVGLTIANSDQVTLTATVPATSSDYSVLLEKTSQTSDVVTRGTKISFRIAYGSSLPTAGPLTVEAQWDLGTIDGDVTPSVDLLSYEPNSASNDFQGNSPVIDPVNRTITWTTDTFPANTENKTVDFSLRVSSTFTQKVGVSLPVHARVIGIGTQTPDSTVTLTYKDPSLLPPTPTPTSAPTTPRPTTPTPTPIVIRPFWFNSVDLIGITESSADVAVSLSEKSHITVYYGTSPKHLDQHFVTSTSDPNQHFTLSDLDPDTPYYFRLVALNNINHSIFSDIYTFQTAKDKMLALLDPTSLVISSDKVILFTPSLQEAIGGRSILPVPMRTPLSYQVALRNNDLITSASLILSSAHVLGTSFPEKAFADNDRISMVEVKKGVYLAKLFTPELQDTYQVSLRLTDANGNISLQPLGILRIDSPFTVLRKSDKEPIESAHVHVSVFNTRTKLYQELLSDFLASSLSTDGNGELSLTLPPGQYKAEVEAIGYQNGYTSFTIGPDSSSQYPTVLMDTAGFSIPAFIAHYTESLGTISFSFKDYLGSLHSSRRLLELGNLIAILIFLSISILLFIKRIGLPSRYFGLFLSHQIAKLKRRQGSLTFSGQVVDAKTKLPLVGVHVFLVNSLNHVALGNTLTNKHGYFSFRNLTTPDLRIELVKEGFIDTTHTVHLDEDEQVFALISERQASSLPHLLDVIRQTVSERGFEVLIMLTLLLQVFFAYFYGILTVFPCMMLSVLNLFYYGYYHLVTRSE